ncbi:FliH/SctL family protein [Salipiger sp. P9]|uniref:FliH/SctL family protein n=1 Tax=Salipiger pentaromativorans TaxID=2943193 RepID=UPI0021574965|nr:FliH/SctL family protein [Salipiger pentaromativorans]MCR8550511.1 FliH/SctL family protein [Salipiger pentaromativorans]
MSFVFDRNFDAEEDALRRGEAPVIGAVFTRAEYEDAVALARAEGFQAGLQQGRAEASETAQSSESARRLAVAEAVLPAMQALFADADRHHAALEAQMVDFVLSVFRQVAPDVSAALAGDQALREAKGAVRMALGSAQLILWVAPEALQTASTELELAARQAGFGGRLTVKSDPALGPGDVRADWDQGVMEYSFREICARILGALGVARQDIALKLGQTQAGENA